MSGLSVLDTLLFYQAMYDLDEPKELFRREIKLTQLNGDIEQEVMWDAIIDKCGSSYTAYDTLAAFIYGVQTFFDTNVRVFNRLWVLYTDDRDYKTGESLHEEIGNERVRTPELTYTDNGTVTPDTTTTSTTGVSAYNESGYSDRDRTTTHNAGSETSENTKRETGTETEKEYHKRDLTGFKGSVEDMYTAAVEAESSFNWYDYVAIQFDNYMCLGVY